MGLGFRVLGFGVQGEGFLNHGVGWDFRVWGVVLNPGPKPRLLSPKPFELYILNPKPYLNPNPKPETQSMT